MFREGMFESLRYARHYVLVGVGSEYRAPTVFGTGRRKVLSVFCALGPWGWGIIEHQLCA